METIEITEKLDEFHEHLKQNPRTILSAKFGDGKTFFLNEYFAKHQIWKDYTPIEERVGSSEDAYFVVLHPVNYSVAKNEDIFEYIKRDILIQLYQEGKIDDVDYKAVFKAIKEELKEKALPMLGDLASLIPGGKIAKYIIELGVDIKKAYDEEKHTAADFIETFVSQRGGIYEDDAYTQMIRKTLEHLKEPHEGFPARKILVIEDLDRLDPGHLFRILNVLGAHIDDNKETNKFGFDNIVLVLDYEVTESMFHHFYGERANYEGYMDKFKSSHVYHYSITQLAQLQLIRKLKEWAGEKVLTVLVDGSHKSIGSISLLSRIQQLSVRKVEHILDNIEGMILQPYVEINGLKLSTKTPLCYLLALLTLMDETYKRPSIMESIEGDDWLEYIGPLVYAEEQLKSHPVESNGGRCDVLAVTEDGIITQVSLHPVAAINSNQGIAEKRSDVIRKAFELAQRIVRDAQGIKLVIK